MHGQVGQAVVGHGDDEDVEVLLEQRVQRRARARLVALGEGDRGVGVDVEAAAELVAIQRAGPLAADEAAAGNPDAQTLGHWYSVPWQPPKSKSNWSSGASARVIARRVSSGWGA